jgi:hypothetical protein
MSRTLIALIFSLALMPESPAAPPVAVQAEINYLLGYVKSSGCEFYRNGSWYDSTRAQTHLRYKYEALAARKGITTAEDFIEKAATMSSLSGKAYQIRCGTSAAVTSNLWLRDALSKFRASGASRKARDTPRDVNRPF